MCKEIKDLKAMAEDKGVEISGLENMPELAIEEIEFKNPWSPDSDNPEYMVSKTKLMTLARTPNGMIHDLNKVSNQYKLVQHHEAVSLCLDAILTGAPEFGAPNVGLYFTDDGGIMYAKMTFPEVIEIQKDDPVKPQVVITNSADLKKRFTMSFGAFRMICENGMVIPDSRFPNYVMIRNLHKQGTLNLDEAIAKMLVGFEDFSETLDIWKLYAELQLKDEAIRNILENSGLSERQTQKVLELTPDGFENSIENALIGGQSVSGWHAYNAATQYITRETVNEGTALDRSRLVSDGFDELLKKAA